MAKSIVGVDIGAASIRAVEVQDADRAKPVILRFAEVPVPEGSTRQGEVVEPNTVAAALRQLWSVGKFRSRDVVLGMGNQRVLSRDLTVPKAPLAQIRESLPFQVQDMLPVPVVDAILDFYPTSEGTSENGPTVSGLLVAAVKDAVLANVRAVQTAGLNPVAVDLIPFALARVLSPSQRSGTTAIVECGGNTTTVVVVTDGVPKFVRIIPTGGEDVTRLLAGRLEVPASAAESVKRHFGMDSTRARTRDDALAVAAVRETVGELLASLRNTMNYFVNTHPSEPVGEVLLVGGAAELPGFASALAEATGLPVRRGEPFTHAGLAKSIRPEDLQTHGSSITVAWGLAVGGKAA
ncbi:pilus assembly protein PilM [Curtobacterium sp. MCJR17_055]|uniref:type IV pilus assembly protein PilM n=1 Tax=unclassified Curtobacterium TaxID=257496 RepID=UPI000D96038C|nr:MULTISPECIES: type IV pilus assembly protein PilM [unclassified Curtobacterium]PYY37693.1 pilus assembly protein PilM [Curtobacterium sp. MCBD17_029]PYY56721.1 pilus assembly protein PilM [Curtobacterium sp. MCJR17_055]PYY62364.1 pilus assembly protein PilM [Curtobacterium sp. MCPF17_015]PZE94631.1 pilus assembly protein PilM [Curtobacterium sp. MCBD17_008]WIB35893.1 type IV pilus assembly protein PilM [Curtobacterium sp. MCJR17_043]